MNDNKMGRKKKGGGFSTPAWMVTYGDMTTLLLTFFILMFTTAEIEGYELRLILSSFSGSFGMDTGGLTLTEGPLAEMGQVIETMPSTNAGSNLDEAMERAVEQFQPEVETQRVKIVHNERGLLISIMGDVFFDPGRAEIKQEGKNILDKVARFIIELKRRGLDNEIVVEGHADWTRVAEYSSLQQELAMSGEPSGTNWELSAYRAGNVIKYFTDHHNISPIRKIESGNEVKETNKFRLSAFGVYKDYAENMTPEDRAYNRRVDILIQRD